jgi:H+/Cl- antiporter ClcA
MFKPHAKLLFFAFIIGIVSALFSHAFLLSLFWVTDLRQSVPWPVLGLPLLGLAQATIQKRIPTDFNWGVPRLLQELKSPQQKAHPLLALWIFLTSLGSHLFGGSVGREGVGLIMSGSFTDGLSPYGIKDSERSILLQAALSAGFAGMFGTPLAGIIFLAEVNRFQDMKNLARLLVIALAVLVTMICGTFLKTPHTSFPAFVDASLSGLALMMIAVPLGSHLFYYSYATFRKWLSPIGFWQMPLGGLLVTLGILLFGHKYAGISLGMITEALNGNSLPWDWLVKLTLTALTIAAGFKGGEVTPLFIIGASLGSLVGSVTSDIDLAKLGLVSLLGSLTHTPLAAAVLAYELFGIKAAFGAGLLSLWGKFTLGKKHLYRL